MLATHQSLVDASASALAERLHQRRGDLCHQLFGSDARASATGAAAAKEAAG